MKLSRYEILKNKKLISETQSTSNTSIKTFTETISFYIKFFLPILIFVLLLLDYLTFTQTFNFEPATFFDVYLFDINISNSPLLLIIGFFPLIGGLLVYMMSYLSIFISFNILKVKTTKIPKIVQILKELEGLIQDTFYINQSPWIDIFVIPIAFVSLLTCSSYGIISLINVEDWLYILVSFIFPLFIAHFGTIRFLKYYSHTEQYSLISFGYLALTSVYIFLSIFLFNWLGQKTLALYLLLILFPAIFSFQVLDTMIDNNYNYKNKSVPRSNTTIVLILLTVVIILGTNSFYKENKKQWTNQNPSSSMTMNLFLNKNFLSTNTELIDLNCSNYRGKDWNQSIQYIALDQNAMYLPISKEMKLYFTDINNTEKTKIYAVQKQFYKGETYYKLYGVGSFKEKEIKNQ